MSTVRERIKKLLSMAQHTGSNDQEAETAMRMAQRLMKEHQVELADLADSGQQLEWSWGKHFTPLGEWDTPAVRWAGWFGVLAVGVAQFTDTTVHCVQHPEYRFGVEFRGDSVDLEYAAWLMERLRDVAYDGARAFLKARAMEDFLEGFASRIARRLRELRQEREQATAGTALVVVSDKLAKRDAHFGVTRYAMHSYRTRNGEAHAAGQVSADRQKFDRPVGGGASAPLLK